MIDDSYDSDFAYPHLDAPQQNDIRWVAGNRAFIEFHSGDPHWSELPKAVYQAREWPEGDRMTDGSDEQGYDYES